MKDDESKNVPASSGSYDHLQAFRDATGEISALLTSTEGYKPSIIAPTGTKYRDEKTVLDIGTALAYSLFRFMASKQVMVPAVINIGFDSDLTPASIGLAQDISFSKIRAALILEGVKQRMAGIGTSDPLNMESGDIASLASSLGIDTVAFTNLMSRTIERMEALLTQAQTASLMTYLMETPGSAQKLAGYLEMPSVPVQDVEYASELLIQINSALLANQPLPAISAMLEKGVGEISCFSSILNMVEIKTYYGLAMTPMSLASLCSIMAASGNVDATVVDSLPFISRSTIADENGRPAQFKFWEMAAPGLYNRVSISDVLTTISAIDTTLFGARMGSITIEDLVQMTVLSSASALTPVPPTGGVDLLRSSTFSGIRSLLAIHAAMAQNQSPILSALKTLMANYRNDDITSAIKPHVALRLEALVAIAEVQISVRALLRDLMDHADHLSFAYFSDADARIGSFDLYPVDGEINVSTPKRKTKEKTIKGTPVDSETPTPSVEYAPFLQIVNREAVKKWYQYHRAALEPIVSLTVDPTSVRYLFNAASIENRHSPIHFVADLDFFLATDSWYTADRTGDDASTGSVKITNLPVPFIMGDRRVFGSTPSKKGYADRAAAGMSNGLYPSGVSHCTVPFFTLPFESAGAFDLTGFTSLFPIRALERISLRSGQPIAQTIAGLVALWQTGTVNFNLTPSYSAVLLRSALAANVGRDTGHVISHWNSLYRNYALPTSDQITGIGATEFLALGGLAFTMKAEPVVLIPNAFALRSERSEMVGLHFSFSAPSFATHEFPHSALTVLNAEVLINPPSGTDQGLPAESLFTNHATSAKVLVDPNAPKPKEDGKQHTNVGLTVVSKDSPLNSSSDADQTTSVAGQLDSE